MGKDDENIRRLSLRIDEELARTVDELSREEGRSFNREILELVRKGIELRNAESRFLKKADPLHIMNAVGSEDEAEKHQGAPGPGKHLQSESEKGDIRELA